MNTESKMIKQGPCPECESSDAYTLYDDGHGYCFSCEFYKPPEGTDRMENNNIKPAPIQGIVQTNFSDGEDIGRDQFMIEKLKNLQLKNIMY